MHWIKKSRPMLKHGYHQAALHQIMKKNLLFHEFNRFRVCTCFDKIDAFCPT